MASVAVMAAGGSIADKPAGFRFFNRHLTIKPYVSLSYSYDSNVDTDKSEEADSIFLVSPGVDFEWNGDRWSLAGGVFYNYRHFCKYSDELGSDGYGENLKFAWTTSEQNEKGWSLILAERYAFISQSDGLNSGSGRGIWRDRETVNFSGAIQRRFTERWHASLSGQYDWLDYKNSSEYYPLYGWSQYAVGLEGGYAATPWTDFLLSGGYSSYNRNESSRNDSDTQTWTLQGGIGTHATKNITYRVLMGASWLDCGGKSSADVGWTYSLSSKWRLRRQWQLSAVGRSYYQPSEYNIGSAIKVYSLSFGVSYLTLGDRLTLTGDVAMRMEDTVYAERAAYDYSEFIVSARLGATYTINRWMSVFANVLWEDNSCDEKDYYDYNRVRGTIGLRFHY
ncbi:MAG: hypothetical protein J6V88_03665 [Kiritimatiellae bacterium]|nr:hypothetical protein [Kiritimatiellia bacterium]